MGPRARSGLRLPFGDDACSEVVGIGPAVLFIGNSYTYDNDVPGMVQALATAAGAPLAVDTVANPDYALIDHWNGGSSARSEIAKGGWQFVVLEQGPSSVEVNRDTLRLAAKVFDAEGKKTGGTTALAIYARLTERSPAGAPAQLTLASGARSDSQRS